MSSHNFICLQVIHKGDVEDLADFHVGTFIVARGFMLIVKLIQCLHSFGCIPLAL